MNLKPKIVFLVKLSISIILIVWLVMNGELSYQNFTIGISNFNLVIVFLLLTFIKLILASIRTHILMQFKVDSADNFKKVLSISWASSFVTCIAPISLFSDIFRIKKMMGIDSNVRKDNAFYASVSPKFFSILGLILITVFVSAISRNHPPEINWLFYALYGVLAFVALLYFYIDFFTRVLNAILNMVLKKIHPGFLHRRVENLKVYCLELFGDKKNLFYIILLSLCIQILNTISFLYIIVSINPMVDIDIFKIASVIPIGILTMMLPISFGGLGVGNMAFSQLLGIYGITNGADVFLLFFAFSYIFNFLGIVPFIRYFNK
ncbi:conserved membrane hypothetical protein [Candidatus Desulfarcum epimagneticum]|uniref:Flippase-like domain-containing protein n=1 Tax=uncultured Desulfobacteraceae bacterium TaxID=218296 RepID=A0A484HGT8_9BACT|nr:conserved membrane hypothetical protein [uncultured Desulfobacteraceae bacterium]